MIQNFNYITPVPQCNELIDIALSKTNRRTPTVIHPGYEIHRIRNFYLRKVKHSSEEFKTRLEQICSQFPVLEDIHPFYADLISVLYDKDHFKIALGQVNATKSKIDKTRNEHVKLLKFGDSLYKCKQLKKAALGKMATQVKKLSEPLKYLEEVRQHLSRLPSIDTSARTIIICGYPNVGKSSFMNKVSRAHVDVQPYAFTTKSLYVGHFDYENLQWQIIDTPGILDHPLQDRNRVEMLTITALAHLKSAVMFFMDLSENCGYSLADQIALYESITPLLNSEVLVVFSKMDILRVSASDDPLLTSFLENKKYVEISSLESVNIEEARNMVCEMLLSERISEKQEKLNGFVHRIKPFIPEIPLNEKSQDVHLGTNPFLNAHENETYLCENKYDVIPEIFNGKNISDFMDRNISINLQRVVDGESDYFVREYDVLTPEQRRMYEDCNNARMHANMISHFNKRASVPTLWKNPVNPNKVKEYDLTEPKVSKGPLALVKESRNKKVQKGVSKKHVDVKPKHLFRPKANKHS